METNEYDKYGIEIEFSTGLPLELICETIGVHSSYELKESRNSFFNIAQDQTADTELCQGFELRTPIFYKFPYYTLRNYLSKLRAISKINNKCGLHIHASGPSFIYLSLLEEYDEFYNICKYLHSKFRPRKERSHFCSVDPIQFAANTKYRSIRKISEDHWEFRVFNSSFDIDYIQKCFNAVLNLRDFYNGKTRT